MPGDNTHVHIIVSRTDRRKKIKLSPLANSKKLFHRENFKLKSCQHFDKNYLYDGAAKELEKHIVMRDGTIEERIAYINEEYERIKIPHLTAENHQQENEEIKKKMESRRGLSLKQRPLRNFGLLRCERVLRPSKVKSRPCLNFSEFGLRQ